MSIFFRRLLPFALLALLPGFLAAQSAPEDRARAEAYLKQQSEKLHPQHGKIPLGKGLATLNLPDDFGYLPPDQAEILLHDIWHNPPGMKTLGALLPSGADPLSREAWAVFITYNNDGHVKDDDAATIDYDALLQKMKDSDKEEMQRRREEGYEPYELVGWATKPHYDKDTHKLYWAVELKPENDRHQHSINYNIRILGRSGYLVLSMVGGMARLPVMEQSTDKILSLVDFDTSQRYADFNPDTDKVAAYGMAALIGGYALAKVGMFKMLIPALLALKKFIVLGILAIVAFFKRLFRRKNK